MYTPESVILAAFVTAVSTISITLYVKYSKSSFLGVKSMLSSKFVDYDRFGSFFFHFHCVYQYDKLLAKDTIFNWTHFGCFGISLSIVLDL